MGWSAVKCEVVWLRVSTAKSEALVLCWKMVDCSVQIASNRLQVSLGLVLQARAKWSIR